MAATDSLVTEPLAAKLDAGVMTLTLNRPEVLNSMNVALMGALADALADVETRAIESQVRALVITGAGRAFCAGADLGSTLAPTGDPPDLGRLLRSSFNPVIERIRSLPLPVIAAVNGVAAGAGMSLALAADIVLAAESAKFSQVFARIGVIPDAGSTWFLPRLVGDVRARALVMLTDAIGAADAKAMGMIWDVVPDAELAARANSLAARLATQPTRAFALAKQALNASSTHTLAEQLELEATLQHEAGLTADFHEGVSAFLAKRPARFSGR
ncbi:MAG: enoyl-CoA hydratase-related protein [Burkholderiaceae bacterium]